MTIICPYYYSIEELEEDDGFECETCGNENRCDVVNGCFSGSYNIIFEKETFV